MISDEAQSLRNDLARYHADVMEHVARCENYWVMVANHEIDLDGKPGNGNHPGLKTRVKSMEDAVEEIVGEAKRRHGRIMAGLWTLGTGLFLAITTTLLAWIVG